MKKLWILLLALCLTGCGKPVYETIGDVSAVPVSGTCQQVLVELPEEAAAPVATQEPGGKVYDCGNYTITVQTLESGDLDKTLRTLTGYPRQQLQVIKTLKEKLSRYDTVFTAAGEEALQVGRVCILDDGAYHYAVTALAPEEMAGQLRTQWDTLFSTVRLVDADFDLNTGS